MVISLGGSRQVRIRPALFGVGVTFAAFLVLIHSASPLIWQRSDYWLIGTGCLLGIIAGSLLYLLAKRALTPLLQEKQRIAFAVGSAIGFVLVFAGMLILSTLPLISGLLAGIGFLIVAIIWCAYYAELMPEESLFNAALALGVSGLLYSVCFLPVISEVPFLYALGLLLVSVILQNVSYGEFLTPEGKGPALSTSFSTTQKESLLQHSRDIANSLWKPLLSAMIAAFITGLVHNPTISNSLEDFALVSNPLINMGAPLLASILTLTAFFIWKKSFTLHVFCNAVMPAAVALLLVIPMINAEAPWARVVMTLLSQGSFAIIVLATWTSLAGSVRTTGSTAGTILTIASILLAAAMLTGIVLVHYIGEGGQILSLVLLTVFLVLMVVDFALSTQNRSVERELQQDVFEHFLRNRCESLTKQFHLTERESEILPYLARGYSHVYTAKELYVSENTVRTHVKHIYSKLGVNSREELISLIDTQRDV